jgi:type I restriction enzyme, S subunit
MSSAFASLVATERWTETTLGEIAEYITSGSRDWSKYYADSGAIFIRTQDINRNRLSLDDAAYVKLPLKVEGKRSLVKKGDLLITITGANVGKVAVVETKIPEAYVSQSVCLVRLNDPSIAKFIHLQLITKRGDKTAIEAMAYGLGRPVLNLENIRSAPIRLALSGVQDKIVAEIEKQFSRLDEAVASLKRIKANLKRYKSAVLKAAIEGKLTKEWRIQHPDVEPAKKLLEPILDERRAKWDGKGKYKESGVPDVSNLSPLPQYWTWCLTDALFSFVTSGSRGWAKYYSDEGPLFLRVGNLDHDSIRLDLSDVQRVDPPAGAEGTRTRVESGDILISITADVGMIAIVPAGLGEAYINQHVSLARPRDGFCRKYLAWYLAAREGGQQIFLQLQRGATKVGLGLDDIRAVPVPLPPLAEQQQIVAEIERRLSVIEELEATVEANLTRADRLRQSILASRLGDG